ncbi:MAG: aromatic ring-hydroxylating dioxygenase subunit alpha [Pseudomonadota bacterium]
MSPRPFDTEHHAPVTPAPEVDQRAAPQADYTDPSTLAAEQRGIFDRDWVMVGRAGSIPEPGDYFTASVGARPIIVIRQDDGSIHAMANFCLHRYARLVDGCGHVGRISCPYHAWTYDRAGRLIGVTDRHGYAKEAIKDKRLPPLACDVWEGFIFVSLNAEAMPLPDRLARLTPHLEAFGLGEYEDRVVVHEEIWDGNWKLIFENFIESYHTTYTHKRSIGPTNPTHLAEFGPVGEEYFSIHSNSYRPEDFPEIHNPALTEEEQKRFYVIALYPNGLVALDPNFAWWITLEPQAVDRTNARWGLCYSPLAMQNMADPEAFVAAIKDVIVTATEEDKEMVGRVQAGSAFGTPEPGMLHAPLEVYIKEFSDYVAKMRAEPTT